MENQARPGGSRISRHLSTKSCSEGPAFVRHTYSTPVRAADSYENRSAFRPQIHRHYTWEGASYHYYELADCTIRIAVTERARRESPPWTFAHAAKSSRMVPARKWPGRRPPLPPCPPRSHITATIPPSVEQLHRHRDHQATQQAFEFCPAMAQHKQNLREQFVRDERLPLHGVKSDQKRKSHA